MNSEVLFFPMTEKPVRDESDPSFSQTVIIYGDQKNVVELGYFDFEEDEWLHFGQNLFMLKCWCYIPNPDMFITNN